MILRYVKNENFQSKNIIDNKRIRSMIKEDLVFFYLLFVLCVILKIKNINCIHVENLYFAGSFAALLPAQTIFTENFRIKL